MIGLFNMYSYILIMSITPGPNNVICLTQGTKFGFKRSLPYIYGVAVGCLTQQWLILFLGRFVGEALPTVTRVISILGAFYMLWIAYKFIRSAKAISSDRIIDQPLGFLTGTVFQYANPKAYVFNTTVITSFILPMGFSLTENLLVSLSTGIIFLICTGAWILFGKAFTSLYDRYHRPITYAMSAALVYLAVTIVWH